MLLYNKLYPFYIIDSEHLIDNPYEGQVSIEYGETETHSDGILKVFFEGKWTALCYSNDFPSNVADSACRQKGYTGHYSPIERKLE